MFNILSIIIGRNRAYKYKDKLLFYYKIDTFETLNLSNNSNYSSCNNIRGINNFQRNEIIIK